MYGLKKGQVGLAKLRLGANSQKPSPPDLIGGFGKGAFKPFSQCTKSEKDHSGELQVVDHVAMTC